MQPFLPCSCLFRGVTFRLACYRKWGICIVFPASHEPCMMIMKGGKARAEGWGQYANSGCTFRCLIASMEWFGETGYHSPPPFPSLHPRISLHLCPPPLPGFCSLPSPCPSVSSLPPFPPVSSSSEYSSATPWMPFSQNIRYICFPLPDFREQDTLHAKCWCVAFLVIITSLRLQENSKLMFNSPLHSTEAPFCYYCGY